MSQTKTDFAFDTVLEFLPQETNVMIEVESVNPTITARGKSNTESVERHTLRQSRAKRKRGATYARSRGTDVRGYRVFC